MIEIELNINFVKEVMVALKNAKETYHQITPDKKMEEIIADSCGKRFEYAMKASLRLMHKFLKFAYNKDEKELTINNTFKLMQNYNFITDQKVWKEYYTKYRDTVDEYNIEKTRELIRIIPSFEHDIEELLRNINAYLQKNHSSYVFSKDFYV